jgi:alpha-1,2-mannosyltransferase
VVLGLLAYKPQFALALPVALLAGAYWRAGLSACVTVAVATGASVAAFGLDTWNGFVASTGFTRHVVLEQGAPGFGKMQSAFAAARLLGGSVAQAYGVQAAVTVSTLVALAWLWRRTPDLCLRLAGLSCATLLTTPYAMDYDMVILALALAALVAHGMTHGFPPYGRSVLAMGWIVPLLARPFGMSFHAPVGLLAVLVLFWHTIIVARHRSSVKVVAEEAQSGPLRIIPPL